MIKRFSAPIYTIFALIFAWKAALVLFFALPAPSNDSFFYDGAVVYLLEGGKYCNPAIRLALPISGTEVFCAYPPLYQVVLLGWMWVFGTSAFSAMLLHLVLFGAYMVILLAIFRCFNLENWVGIIAALFLLAITFNDRPDSLAHVFGVLAVYCWVRAGLSGPKQQVKQPEPHSSSPFQPSSFNVGWSWLVAVFCILALATGLQIGALYVLVLLLAWGLNGFAKPGFVPWGPMAATVLIPAMLIALVVFGFPRLWQGFLEHANQTPSFTGFRLPAIEDILKMVRNVPGILAVGLLLMVPSGFRFTREYFSNPHNVLLIASTGAALAMIGGAMFVLTPNALTFAIYLQPLIVALWLDRIAERQPPSFVRLQRVGFVALALLTSIRAIGLTTWGTASAIDFGYQEAIETVRTALQERPPGSPVVLSSAYLYDAHHLKEFKAVHSDWLKPGEHSTRNTDWEGVLELKPSKIILTPFDYYRRYEPLIRLLQERTDLVEIRMQVHGSIPPPDAFPKLRRVVQHLSWAPIVISLGWDPGIVKE